MCKKITDIADKLEIWVRHVLLWIYSQTCIKRSPLGQRKSGFI